ncbi:gamma-glutamyltranspeptidase / glutathione hydrolase [Bhargavaea ginsengi]|uniref:Gamma-glutamyltranspeptidase / glutathione hydrolase n=1 Tax=Bhargavaea ginsengi TaxID=426757 RepID=A0A1H6TMR4_9BACL|nr:gamma-glutamyltransferase family protein [Bhargavaea ginsengi]SEI81369.1 gamma-glutamyltranspeptidase / glutathione hydrolase [Bhargavaea ginsengi]
MDYLYHPFRSQRHTVFAKNGVVATSQPLAAQAGIEIMRRGGNAIDAAIATAAALTVVEPTSNGIGGDAFALIWTEGKLHGLNASGPASMDATAEKVKALGHEKMPVFGAVPVTVPGAPSAWAEVSRRFGKLSLSETLEPAVRLAEEGYPLTPILGKYWEVAYNKFKNLSEGSEEERKSFEAWFDTFAPDGRPPKTGEMWRSPGHADTLRQIGETDGRAFYEGPLAEQIADAAQAHGGFLSKEDLAAYQPEWVEPVSANYRGYDVWEIPPNGQGMVALMALNIHSATGKQLVYGDAETLHRQIEAMKLAFTDGKAFITQPDDMPVETAHLLSPEYAEKRAAVIGDRAIDPEPYELPKGGTVYLAVADGEGNMVSFIQSNYMGFGSGIVVPNTGIALQNRGADFSLDPEHPNYLKPGKKTYHTIIPGFLTKNGEAVGPFGVMGGYMQPQGHFQVISNTVDFGLNPQAALDQPRWQWVGGKTVQVEPDFPLHLAQALQRKGHDIRIATDSGGFGRGQIIWRNPETGVLEAGTESRTDGSIAVW